MNPPINALLKPLRRVQITDAEALVVEDASGTQYLVVDTEALGGTLFDPGAYAGGNSWPREGQTITSAFFSVKRDVARRNSGAQVLFSDDGLRATDFSLLRAGALDEDGNPTVVPNNAVCTNMRIEAHDGTDFFVTGLFRVQVEGTPAENDVRSSLKYITWDGSTNSAAWTATSDRKFGVNTVSMVSQFEANGSSGNKVTTLNSATLTLDETHHTISVTYTSTGAVTITLPSASSAWNSTDGIGREYVITDTACMAASNNITVNRAGSDTIATTNPTDTSVVMNGNGDTVRLQAVSSTKWKLI